MLLFFGFLVLFFGDFYFLLVHFDMGAFGVFFLWGYCHRHYFAAVSQAHYFNALSSSSECGYLICLNSYHRSIVCDNYYIFIFANKFHIDKLSSLFSKVSCLYAFSGSALLSIILKSSSLSIAIFGNGDKLFAFFDYRHIHNEIFFI